MNSKKVLALAVLAALSTTPAWASGVQLGYTPQSSETRGVAETRDEYVVAAVNGKQMPADAVMVATPELPIIEAPKQDVESDSTLAAIQAARGGFSEAEEADKKEAQRVRVDNSSLATKEKEVLTITNAAGDKLEKQQAESTSVEVEAVEAKYYSTVQDEQILPYVGKTVSGLDVEGVEAAYVLKFADVLNTKIGESLTVEGVKKDIAALGSTGVVSEITPVFSVVPEGVKVAYQLTINPIIQGVEVTGSTVYPKDNLLAYLGIRPNTVLNTVAVGEKIQGINAAYQRDGYVLSRVNNVGVDDQGILHIDIIEGTVEKIMPHGNKKTKDYVITREFNQKEGKPFNKFLVRRSVEKVYNLGYFDDVNVRITEGSAPDKVNLSVDVLEHKTGTITLGAGYSGSDGFVGIVEVGEENLRGTGDKVKVHWEFGGSAGYKNYAVSYFRPWLDKKATSLGVTYFNRVNEYADYNEDGEKVAQYDRASKGFNISLGRQTGEFSRDYLTLESRKDTYRTGKNSQGFIYNVNEPQEYKGEWYRFKDLNYVANNFGTTNSISWQKVYDSRDNIYEPSRGKRLSSTVQWAGHGLGGDFDFYKVNLEARTYKKIGKNQVLAFRGRLGWAQGDVPYSQLFTVGGAESLRGYEDDQYRGKKMYSLTAEYRFPVWKKISGALFVDMGDAWDAPNVNWYRHSSSFNASVGAGLRVATPIGPVRIDYGVGKNDSKFHFSFGGQF